MQRKRVIGAVIAALGALLYLQLESGTSSIQAASGERRVSSPGGRRQWLPWASQPSTEEEASASDGQAGSSEQQASSASEEDAADLPGTFSLRGSVTDENGQPLADATVSARPSANSLAQTSDEAETDAQGRFRLRSLAPGLYDLRVSRAHYLRRTLETWRLNPNPDLLTVQLLPAPTIQGRVVDTAGTPMPGVEVKLFQLKRELVAELQPPTPENETAPAPVLVEQVGRYYAWSEKSEPDGTFILDTNEPGEWLLQTEHKGFSPVERELTSPARDVQLVLGAGTWVEVTVVDAQDQPVPQANVVLWREEDEEGVMVHLPTDETGHGVVHGLQPGRYGLAATPPSKEGFRLAAASLAVHGEKSQQVRLRFDKGQSLSGVVVDRAGTPIPDVEVEARFLARREILENPSSDVETIRGIFFRLGRWWDSTPHRARTGPDGRFTLPQLMPFMHRLSFEKSGYVLSGPFDKQADGEQPRSLVVSPRQDGLRVLMSYRGRVSGRVVRAADGEPIASFQIDGQSYSSPDGTFTRTAEEPGPYTLDVVAPGVGGLHVRYEIREGEDVALGDLVVGDGRPVRVRVEDTATALPIRGALLELREATPGGTPARVEREGETEELEDRRITDVELGLESMAETGRDGRCLLPDVPTRSLSLTAERKGYEPASVVLSPGEQEVTLRMRAWATVQGWVRVDGKPVAKGDVSFYTLEGMSLNDLEVRNGWYSGHLFPPGRYLVRAECDSCPRPSPVFVMQQLEVPGPQGTLSMDFQEVHGATLEIITSQELADIFLIQGQAPLPASSGELNRLSRSSHPHDLLEGADSGYRFTDVPPGRYTLFFAIRVDDESSTLQREELQIPAEGVLRIQLPSAVSREPVSGSAP